MSDELLPTHELAPYRGTQLQEWQEPMPPATGTPASTQSPLERPLAAVRRYKWLMLGIVVVATAAGVGATRFITPQYDVQARIMIASQGPMENRVGPIRAAGLLEADDWSALLTSGAISDAVVRQLKLYLQPDDRATAPLFKNFGLSEPFYPGKYELLINSASRRWKLSLNPSGEVVDSGLVTDSIGRRRGFLWTLPAGSLAASGEQRVRFTVSTPRETAVRLTERLGTRRMQESNFLILTFSDANSQLAASILNTWAREFVDVAARLKKRKLTEFTTILDGQLRTAKATLDSADLQLSAFKVNTITKPTENAPIAAGVQETQDPVMKDFFAKKLQQDELERDIQQLRSVIATTPRDSVPTEALLQIRTVATSPAAQTLRTALNEYESAVGKLDTLRVNLTDQNPTVKAQLGLVRGLRSQKIPQYITQLFNSLVIRATDDSARIAGASVNLQQIPQRTIEEDRLRRNRDVVAGIYANLQSRYAEAELAEASETPDLMILDSAIAPLSPTSNTAPRVILMAVIGGIGAAVVLALLLDRLDGRFRYPEQATDELGLNIAATVPRFPKGGVNQNSPEQMFQLVESFRTLRMAVVNATNNGPVAIAVSSPSPGDGKSLISANLAMSFADAGFRTALVDGDTRRGVLHELFALSGKPGLTDYLAETASLPEVLRRTNHDLLSVIPSGTRKRRSPELLTSAKLPELVAQLRRTHDVVIFDTPPLAAGVDGYSIASATGSLLVVLRVGKTMRRMAAEKLRVFDRLPVNIVGAVLNGIANEGAYSYYGYVPGYFAEEESEHTDVAKVT